MEYDPVFLKSIEKEYLSDKKTKTLAIEAARTESSGYCKKTRIEEIMDFAQRIKADKIGIAHCVGLMHEAKTTREIFIAGGFKVFTACCKMGSINKEKLGLKDEEKVRPGQYEALCNPIAQAKILEKAGSQLNVVLGLCVGHDTLFFAHSKVPVTVLIAKDRVLGHNPVAALYTHHSYYKRLKN
jgi:uncharacterized metal-binding protein